MAGWYDLLSVCHTGNALIFIVLFYFSPCEHRTRRWRRWWRYPQNVGVCVVVFVCMTYTSATTATDSGAHDSVKAEVCNLKFLESCGIYMIDFNYTKYSAEGHEEWRQEWLREQVLLTAGPGDLHKTRKTSVSCFMCPSIYRLFATRFLHGSPWKRQGCLRQ